MLKFHWRGSQYLELMLGRECVGYFQTVHDERSEAHYLLPGLKGLNQYGVSIDRLEYAKERMLKECLLWFHRAGIVDQWLDIDSAPKDGTKIITLDPHHETDSIAVNWWFNKGEIWSNGGSNPQFWMPLPITTLPDDEPLGEHGIGFASELCPELR